MKLVDITRKEIESSGGNSIIIEGFLSRGKAQVAYLINGGENVLKIPDYNTQNQLRSPLSGVTTLDFNKRLLKIVEASGSTNLPGLWDVIEIPKDFFSNGATGIEQCIAFIQRRYFNTSKNVNGYLPNIQNLALRKDWEKYSLGEEMDDLPNPFEARSSELQEFCIDSGGNEVFFDWDSFLSDSINRAYFKKLIESGVSQSEIEAYYKEKWIESGKSL